MDLSSARLDTIEDFTVDRSNSGFHMSNEALQKQISELTEQLNESTPNEFCKQDKLEEQRSF